MSFQSLFNEGHPSEGRVRIPNNFGDWQDAILKELYKTVPQSLKLSVRLVYKDKDEEKGYAVGSILIVSKSDGKKATVPFVIKDFSMFPLDVFIVDKGLFLPLSEAYFKKHFDNNDIFSKAIPKRDYDLASPHSSNQLINDLNPPIHTKHASVSQEILGTLDRKSIKDFKKKLMDSPESFAALAGNSKAGRILKKLCCEEPAIEKKASSRDIDTLCIERVGFNKYKAFTNSSDEFSPQTEIWDYDMLKKAGVCDFTVNNGCFYKGASKASPMVEEDMVSSPVYMAEKANTLGTYSVRTVDGTLYAGAVIPMVIDFNQNRVRMKYFIGGDKYALQPDFVGVKKDNAIKLDHGSVEPGVTGMFAHETSRGVVATVPVTIVSTSKDEGTNTVDIWARTHLGKNLRLTMSPGLKKIAPVGQNRYILPLEMKFVNLGSSVKLVNSESSYKALEKVAHRADTQKLRIIGNGLTFSFQTNGIEKYASQDGFSVNAGMLRPFEARCLLMSFGASPQDSETLLKTANARGECSVLGLNFPPLKSDMDKIASEHLGRRNELFEHISKLRCDMIKEAGALISSNDSDLACIFVDSDDAMFKVANKKSIGETVDTVLSLNFVNKNNITKFVAMKPLIELAASKIAQLLIASRLGVKLIPEEETATVLHNLNYVIEGLNQLDGAK